MNAIRIGLVGVGKIARDQHLPVLSSNADFELVAAASRNGKVQGLANYPDLAAMLAGEPSLEAVSLCTPPTAREDDARLALSCGVHVLLEKPPTAALGAARALLALAAQADGAVLCASWHSRHAACVEAARAWLSTRTVTSVAIDWKEDIRIWHPGQDWILDAGGMGVFDPGINALSVLTHILPGGIVLTGADLSIPANRQAPLAADLLMRTSGGAGIHACFDFLQTGTPIHDIRVRCEGEELLLSDGGSKLRIDQDQTTPAEAGPHHEYVGVYRRFAACIRARRSECDLRPLELVADAFLCGRRRVDAAFHF